MPHRLIEAFKATLEEALLADFLIHLLDASDPEVFGTYTTTHNILTELGAEEKRKLLILNKADLVTDPAKRAELERHFPEACFTSVVTGEGLDTLRHRMSTMLAERVQRRHLRIPQSRHDLIARLHREAKVISSDYEGNDVLLQVVVPKAMENLLAEFVEDAPEAGTSPIA